jgi:IS5 family transposase
LPIDPSSRTRWHKRLSEAGVEDLLAETIGAAKRASVIKTSSLERVIVETIMMEKAIAHPTDSRPLERCKEHGVKAAAQRGLKLQPRSAASGGPDRRAIRMRSSTCG